ncbi:hypothetical protein HZC07_00200 [Candidatus Micrarchaeota archaeon]|nr:hypothetical protein [Candidatus Micrarchaeota archaeon]
MGFLETLMRRNENKESAENTSNSPFRMNLSFSPLRLSAMKDNKVNMIIKITNLTKEPQLVSLDANLQNRMLIGFEPTCIHKTNEKKVGELKPNETREIVIPIWGTNQTKPGDYTIEVSAYCHYITYEKVVSYVRKRINLRVV